MQRINVKLKLTFAMK